MDRVVLIVGAVVIAAGVAYLLGRRRPAVPTNPAAHIPRQLARADFARPDSPWLVAVFTSESCSTCAAVWEQARELEGPRVAVQELEATRDGTLHARYSIDSVPVLVIADGHGVVRRWFLGPVDRTELKSALASSVEG